MYKEVLKRHGVTQTSEFTQKILMYECGKLCQIEIYRERFGKSGYVGEYSRELSDVITMLFLLGEQRGEADVEDLERTADRMATRASKTPEDVLMMLTQLSGRLYPTDSPDFFSFLVQAIAYAKILAANQNLSWMSLVDLGLKTFDDRIAEVKLEILRDKTRNRG